MRATTGKMALVVLAVLAGGASLATAETGLVGVSVGTGWNSYPEYSMGWQFTPTADIRVTKLGFWAPSGVSSYSFDHVITIYDSAGAAKISGTVAAGSIGDKRENSYAYVDVSAQNVVLAGGQTYVIASYWHQSNTNWFDMDIQYTAVFSAGNGITLGQVDLATTGLAKPTDLGNTWNTFLSANFQFVPANQPPVAVDDSVTTYAGVAVEVEVLANDSDPDAGDVLSVASFTQGANGSVSGTGNPLIYTPAPGFLGTDSFEYTVTDAKGATATGTVTVAVVNRVPAALDKTALTQRNTPITVDVLAGAGDPDGDALSIDSFTQGTNGAVAAAASGLTYTPNLDFFGTDSFTYTITDSKGGTATANVAVTVNKPPVAAPDAGQTEVGQAITITVLSNDHDDDGDALTVTAVGAAVNGTVALNTNETVTYTPNAGFAGQDEFSYGISDGRGGTCTAEVLIVVNPKDVLIDIKPGSYPNSINLGSNGVVPIAILSTPDFDATTVDPATVSMAGAGVAVRGKANRYLASNQDVNADGRLDLVLQVETENLDPAQLQAGYATVVGTTLAGVPIIGTDEITLVPSN